LDEKFDFRRLPSVATRLGPSQDFRGLSDASHPSRQSAASHTRGDNRRSVMTFLRTSAFAAAALLLGGVAQAGETAATVAVAHGDLDLATAKDAATFVARVDQAARDVCGVKAMRDPAHRTVRTYVIGQFSACHDQAMQTALARIESQEVRNAYAAYRQERDARG
jgi:UrcA family protein